MDLVSTDDIARFARWVHSFSGLETPRLRARPLRMEDAEALFQAMQHPRVNRWISGFAQPFDLSAARRWLAPRLERMAQGEGVYGAVFYQDSPVMLGFFHAVMEPDLGGIEYAGAIHEIYWGKGFVEEFSFAMLNELFSAGTPTIVATCALNNWSSMRALETLNFNRQRQVTVSTPQGPRPSWLYDLTPERWKSVRILPLGDGLTPAEIGARRQAVHQLCQEMKTARDYLDRGR